MKVGKIYCIRVVLGMWREIMSEFIPSIWLFGYDCGSVFTAQDRLTPVFADSFRFLPGCGIPNAERNGTTRRIVASMFLMP